MSPEPPGSPAPSPRRIVIVDDADDMRDAMRVLLEMAGYEVFTACNGSEGVTQILEVEPWVAFVDLALPDVDGYEIARQVRARATAEPYLVAMSGYVGADSSRRAVAAGFDHQLAKPMSLADIRAAIARRQPRSSRG